MESEEVKPDLKGRSGLAIRKALHESGQRRATGAVAQEDQRSIPRDVSGLAQTHMSLRLDHRPDEGV